MSKTSRRSSQMSTLSMAARAAALAAAASGVGGTSLPIRTVSAPLEPDLHRGSLPVGVGTCPRSEPHRLVLKLEMLSGSADFERPPY